MYGGAQRSLPLFELLKWSDKFQWTNEADKALQQLKDFFSKPPILATPKPKELLLYIAMTTHVVSTKIMIERPKEGHVFKV